MTAPDRPATRPMQPVVELRLDTAARSYAYAVRAPRSGGVVPPLSYRDGGFDTLAECLRDVAGALGANFPRIYVRLDGHCVGERDILELRRRPVQVAAELEAACREACAAKAPAVSAAVPTGQDVIA